VGRVPCQREDGVGVDGRALDAAGVAELAAELGRAALGE